MFTMLYNNVQCRNNLCNNEKCILSIDFVKCFVKRGFVSQKVPSACTRQQFCQLASVRQNYGESGRAQLARIRPELTLTKRNCWLRYPRSTPCTLTHPPSLTAACRAPFTGEGCARLSREREDGRARAPPGPRRVCHLAPSEE